MLRLHAVVNKWETLLNTLTYCYSVMLFYDFFLTLDRSAKHLWRSRAWLAKIEALLLIICMLSNNLVFFLGFLPDIGSNVSLFTVYNTQHI